MKNYLSNKKAVLLFIAPAMILFITFVFIPIVQVFYYSFFNWDGVNAAEFIGFDNYKKLFGSTLFSVANMNGLKFGLLITVYQIFFATIFALAVSDKRVPFRKFFRTAYFIPVVLSVTIVCQLWVSIFDADHGLLNTHFSLIFPYAAINLAFACMVYYGFFKGIPREMEEAACMDGASIYQTFFHIIIPLVAPATITILIYVFLSCWNEFILANVLVGTTAKLKTLPLGVLFFQGQFTTDWGSMGATMVIASLPAVLLYCLFSERVEQAMTVNGAVKG